MAKKATRTFARTTKGQRPDSAPATGTGSTVAGSGRQPPSSCRDVGIKGDDGAAPLDSNQPNESGRRPPAPDPLPTGSPPPRGPSTTFPPSSTNPTARAAEISPPMMMAPSPSARRMFSSVVSSLPLATTTVRRQEGGWHEVGCPGSPPMLRQSTIAAAAVMVD